MDECLVYHTHISMVSIALKLLVLHGYGVASIASHNDSFTVNLFRSYVFPLHHTSVLKFMIQYFL